MTRVGNKPTSIDVVLTGADVLRPDGFAKGDLAVAGGVITSGEMGGKCVDLSGYRILPGIVDLHGDGFEHHLAPRRGVMKDLREGLYAVDAELAANGVTTAVLAQFFSWEGGMRSPDFAERMVEALDDADGLRTDMKVQLRLEINLLDEYERALALIHKAGIGYVVFNDHLPHEALAKGKRPPRLTGQALKSGRSPEAHHEYLKSLHAKSTEVSARLSAFAAELSQSGVLIGSHDDATATDREIYRTMNARISEFPETVEAAQAARDGGDRIVLGSPNAVRGGSHKGNASVRDLVARGLCDALASDYHYPSLRQAALLLAEDIGFEAAWNLVSSGPADILGLTDRGRLHSGLRADFVVMDDRNQIAATFCGGVPSWMAGDVAARFIG